MNIASIASLILALSGLVSLVVGLWRNRKTAASVATEVVNSALTTMQASMDRQSDEIRDLRAHVADLVVGLDRCEDEKAALKITTAALETRVHELEAAR